LSITARILIVAREDTHAGALSDDLDRLGWRTITARGPFAAMAALADLPIEAAIVDITGDPESLLLARRLRAASPSGRLPVIALGEPSSELEAYGFDLVLPPPVFAAQAILRIESLVRMAIAEEEFDHRCDTFIARGHPLQLTHQTADRLKILAVGEPDPRFLALTNALKAFNAEVVGAFTAYTAFDYLHERDFDTVVLWGGEDEAEALSIASGMRRNTRLYHLPTLLYLNENSELEEHDAFTKGVSDLASPHTPEVDTARRIVELARYFRRQSSIRTALVSARTSGLMDAATGLFTRDLFASHLARLGSGQKSSGRPLSVAVLRIAERPEVAKARRTGWLDKAIPQIGSMVSHLVRVEDTAARLAPEVFALALPATSLAQSRAAAERISAVLGCTAFDAGEDERPFVVGFDIGVCEVDPALGPVKALETAAMKAARREAI
jgi:two-component system cell cycle response regulator PopA